MFISSSTKAQINIPSTMITSVYGQD